jgi:hypothetical protein
MLFSRLSTGQAWIGGRSPPPSSSEDASATATADHDTTFKSRGNLRMDNLNIIGNFP